MIRRKTILPLLLILLSVAVETPATEQPAPVPNVPGAFTLKANGGWCWFQGPRVIVTRCGQLVFTSISGTDSAGYDAGDLWATTWDPESNQVTHAELHDRLQRDDHNAAGLLERPDGRILAVYGKHGSDRIQRWRITTHPQDTSDWSDERQLDTGARYTYSNVFRLSQEKGRIYNFSRTRGYNPNCTVSDDDGDNWHYGFRLLAWEKRAYRNDPRYTGIDGGRPYLRYASDGEDTIHFVTTDDHPRAYDNSIYHGFYRHGKLHNSRGTVVGVPGMDGTSPLAPRSFTEVFAGSADRVAWTTDLELDEQGNPYTVFSVQVDGAAGRGKSDVRFGQDHRYYYARQDGNNWHVHQMAHAGTCLYTRESDYTGLVALDPQDPDYVVISTNAHPQTGEPLISRADGQRHWELFRGRTQDRGKSWQWTPITSDSGVDNLRPVIPQTSGRKRYLLWARGKLHNYTNYDLDIVGLRERDEPTPKAIDAKPVRSLSPVDTLNQKEDGYRGIWYMNQPSGDEYVYKYSGGLGTYCAKHKPFAVYCKSVNRTFFCYGGTTSGSHRQLVHMVSYFDHTTGQVPRPVAVLNKNTSDAHDNPVISIDEQGYIWVFSTSHGTSRPSFIHRSTRPYRINEFERVPATRLEGDKWLPITNFSYMQAWHVKDQGFICFFTRYNNPAARTICCMTSPDGIRWSETQRLAAMHQGHYQISAAGQHKAGSAFNYHPNRKGLNWRTNLYYMETLDMGGSWHSVDGRPLIVPLTAPQSSALVHDYQSEGQPCEGVLIGGKTSL